MGLKFFLSLITIITCIYGGVDSVAVSPPKTQKGLSPVVCVLSEEAITQGLSGAVGAITGEVLADLYIDGKGKPVEDLSSNEVKIGELFSQVGSVFIAAVSDLDPTTASHSAGISVQENAFFIPLLVAGATVYEAYDVYQTYQNEGAEAALTQLGISVVAGACGGVVLKVGGKAVGKVIQKAYPSIEVAFQAIINDNPCLKSVFFQGQFKKTTGL